MTEALDRRILRGAPQHVNLRAVVDNVVQTATGGLQALSQILGHRPSHDRCYDFPPQQLMAVRGRSLSWQALLFAYEG